MHVCAAGKCDTMNVASLIDREQLIRRHIVVVVVLTLRLGHAGMLSQDSRFCIEAACLFRPVYSLFCTDFLGQICGTLKID